MRKLVILIAVTLSACSVNTHMMLGPQSVGKYEKPCGIGHGTASQTFIFGFSQGGASSAELLKNAVENAKLSTCGDTMMNIFADQIVTYFPFPFFSLFTSRTVSVYGTMVNYVDDQGKQLTNSN